METQFKKELKALLAKYNASICFEVGEGGSDTYGLYDETMTVCFRSMEPKKPFKITCHKICSGWTISKTDL